MISTHFITLESPTFVESKVVVESSDVIAGGTEICAVIGTVTGVPFAQVSVNVEENAPSVAVGIISTTESIWPGVRVLGGLCTMLADPTGVIDALKLVRVTSLRFRIVSVLVTGVP